MAGKLAHARQKLAAEILKEFKGKITGETIKTVVGENPENKFFVGKLLTNKSDGGNNYSTNYKDHLKYVEEYRTERDKINKNKENNSNN